MFSATRPSWRTLILRGLARGGRCGTFYGILTSGLWLGGCSHNGSYQVSWKFAADPAAAAATSFMPGDCGNYGVSAIAIAGTGQDGAPNNPVVACGPGTATHSLPAGTWTLVLTALDAEGHPKEPTGNLLRGQPAEPVVVVEDQLTTVVDPVVLLTLPQCRDGVDNDRDGRVDLDDPDCAGNSEGSVE